MIEKAIIAALQTANCVRGAGKDEFGQKSIYLTLKEMVDINPY